MPRIMDIALAIFMFILGWSFVFFGLPLIFYYWQEYLHWVFN